MLFKKGGKKKTNMMRTACGLDPSVSIRLCVTEHQQSSNLDFPWSNVSTIVAAIYPEEETSATQYILSIIGSEASKSHRVGLVGLRP